MKPLFFDNKNDIGKRDVSIKNNQDVRFAEGGLVAPNGNTSNLTTEQYNLVRTPAFKQWFGDWENSPETASKIVDINGEPLVCYHGNNKKNISIFDIKKLGTVQYSDWGSGFYFTPSKSTAHYYSAEAQKKINKKYNAAYEKYGKTKSDKDLKAFQNVGRKLDNPKNPIIYEVFLDIKSPYREIVQSMSYTDPFLSNYAKEKLKDGILIMRNYNPTSYDELIVFQPNQIKLADGTNTTFDGGNPDIRFADGGTLNKKWSSVGNMTKSEAKKFYESKEGKELDKQTYNKWKLLVNMSASELESFYNTEDGKEAGLSSKKANQLGISSGRESARWIMKMKKIPYTKWTNAMWIWAKKQISFISRMSGNKGDLYDDKGNKTRKHTSLLIWGHNPDIRFAKGGLVAPNGNTSNLTTEQYNLVRTLAFKKWFGDWENDAENSSKVVDENGEPLVVYHGTRSDDFYEFENKLFGYRGFYFTDKKSVARNYGSNIRQFFLNSKNFVSEDMKGGNYSDNEWIDDLVENSEMDNKDVHLLNFIDPLDPSSMERFPISNIYIIFNKSNIKLADGTNTTFDANNNDIRYKQGGITKAFTYTIGGVVTETTKAILDAKRLKLKARKAKKKTK